MKKVFKATIALLGILVLGAFLSSCGKQQDPTSNYVYYRAYGDIILVNAGQNGLFGLSDYTAAINNAVGDGLTTPKDDIVIEACNEVYLKHLLVYDKKISGYAEIHRIAGTSGEQEHTVIRKFTY